MHSELALLEAMLEWKTFLVGNARTLVDAYAFTIVRWSLGLEKTYASYPNIKRHHDNMLEDPIVQKVLKIHNPEA